MDIQHGTLTILPQQRPSFTRTKGGGFDQGQRVYKVASANARNYLEKLFTPGRSDRDIALIAGLINTSHGRPTEVFKYMCIDTADITFDDGSTAHITANFLGLLGTKPKEPTCIRSTTYNQKAVIKPGTNYVSIINEPKPTLSYVFCLIGQRPSLAQSGEEVPNPLGTQAAENAAIETAFNGFYPVLTPLFQGWVRTDLSIRCPGDISEGHVYEVSTSLQWHVVPALE
jgi:hypothetical protein